MSNNKPASSLTDDYEEDLDLAVHPPEPESDEVANPEDNPENDDSNDDSNNEEKKISKKEKILLLLSPIFRLMAKLKQKKVWIPLVLGHAIMFSGIGYYIYSKEKYAKTADFLVESISETLLTNDIVTFAKIFSANLVMNHFNQTVRGSMEKYPNLATYLGELPDEKTINTIFEQYIVNTISGQETFLSFNDKLRIIPSDFAKQIHESPFQVYESENSPSTNSYIIGTELTTTRWGKYPFKLKAQLHNDKWYITQIANLEEIMQVFENELVKERAKEDAFLERKNAQIDLFFNSYLTNPTCTATIAEISGSPLLLINTYMEANSGTMDLVSWGVDVTITLANGALIKESYIKVNGLYKPGKAFQYSVNEVIPEDLLRKINSQPLLCKAKGVFINFSNGEYHSR